MFGMVLLSTPYYSIYKNHLDIFHLRQSPHTPWEKVHITNSGSHGWEFFKTSRTFVEQQDGFSNMGGQCGDQTEFSLKF